ncbi:restriction endonuclease [Candidatus Bathyarchaeota archaeon]|nr:restriction endonuclease [Candidatus Bathyarchaeota archaeon]
MEVSARSGSVDDKEEIKKAILRRFYDGAFKDGVDYQFGLRAYAEEKGIGWELINEIYDELDDASFFGICCTSMVVEPSVKALVYCEDHQLVDPALVEQQKGIRKRILEAFADILEEKLNRYAYGGIDSDMICKRAGISFQDFSNNAGILEYLDYLERQRPVFIWRITDKGKDAVKNLRRKRARQMAFNDLKAGIVTPQERGHRIEDLLVEVIRDEGWNATPRVRAEGVEHDILFNKDRDYFLVSCKWLSEKVQWIDVSPLISEAEGAGCYAGIVISMSGFTEECIGRVRARKTPQKILLFGHKDVELLFSNAEEVFSEKQWFTDLLDEKIKKLVHQNIILVDGVSN